MTKSLIQQGEDAFDKYSHLTSVIKTRKQDLLILGKLLYELKQKNTYKKAVGEGALDRWTDFLKLPEVGLTTRQADMAIVVYEELILNLEIDPSDVVGASTTNLTALVGLIKKGSIEGEEVADLFEDAKQLTTRDFKERVYEYKHPEKEQTFIYMVMKKCVETGTLRKEHGIATEQIEKAFDL